MQRQSYQHQNKPDRVIGFICNVLDAEDAEHVAGRLPQRSHRYDPAVAFAVDDGLDNVCGKSEAKEDGEEVCGSGIWAESWPFRVWIRLRWAASHHGQGMQKKPKAAEMMRS